MTPSRIRILVADDEPSIVSSLRDALVKEGYQVFTAGGGEEACTVAEREQVHIALVDLVMPDITGLDVMTRLKEKVPAARVIIMTAYATVETAVEVMKQGALDYLIKPFSMDELRMQIRRAAVETEMTNENLALRREVERRAESEDIVGEDPALLSAVGLARRVADSDSTVLILGETGTGKELIARLIHRNSAQGRGLFLAVNCGAIPENLLERELFGNERGAFTGADAARPGLLEAASDGTILLDEIGDMPPALQVKLLRVLEGHEFLRVGGTKPLKSHVRFLASTNRDLGRVVAEKKFREDLFYRLNVVKIELPPLRKRGNDVFLLAEHFIRTSVEGRRKGLAGLSPEAQEAVAAYPWPGNVRELKNIMERGILLSTESQVGLSDLGLGASASAGGEAGAAWMDLPYRKAHDEFERIYLERALKAAGGNVSRAATRMGVDRTGLHSKLKKYNLTGRD